MYLLYLCSFHNICIAAVTRLGPSSQHPTPPCPPPHPLGLKSVPLPLPVPSPSPVPRPLVSVRWCFFFQVSLQLPDPKKKEINADVRHFFPESSTDTTSVSSEHLDIKKKKSESARRNSNQVSCASKADSTFCNCQDLQPFTNK